MNWKWSKKEKKYVWLMTGYALEIGFGVHLKERIDWEINSKSGNENKFNSDLDKRLVWVLPLDDRDEK